MSSRLRPLLLTLLFAGGCAPQGPEPTADPTPAKPPEPPRPIWPARTPAFTTTSAALPASAVAALAIAADLGAAVTSTRAPLLDAVGALLDLPPFELPLRAGAPAVVGWTELEAEAWFAVLPVDDVPLAMRRLGAKRGKRGVATSTLTPGVSWLRAEGHLVATPSENARALGRALKAPRASPDRLGPLFDRLAFGATASGFVSPPEDSGWPFGDVVFGVDPGPEHLLAKGVVATSSAAAAGPLDLAAVPWTHTSTPALFATLRTSPELAGAWARFAVGFNAKRWEKSLTRPPWSSEAQASLTGEAATSWSSARYGRNAAVAALDAVALTATVARPPRHLDADGRWLTLGSPRLGGRPLWAGWSPRAQRLLPAGETGAFVAMRPVALFARSPLGMMMARDVGILGLLGMGMGGKKHARVMEKVREVRKTRDAALREHRRGREEASRTVLERLGYLVGAGRVEGDAWVLRGGFTGPEPQVDLHELLVDLERARPKTEALADIQAMNARIARLERRARKLSSAHMSNLFGSMDNVDWGASIGSSLDSGGLIGTGGMGLRGTGRGGGGTGMGRIGGLGRVDFGGGRGGGGTAAGIGGIARRTPRPKLTVLIGEAPAEIVRFVRRKQARLRRCYSRTIAKDVLGTLRVTLSADPAGMITVADSAGPAQPKVGDCVRRVLRGRVSGVEAGEHRVQLRYAK